MARLPKDDFEEDENITLTPNEGVDEEDLKNSKVNDEDDMDNDVPESVSKKKLEEAESDIEEEEASNPAADEDSEVDDRPKPQDLIANFKRDRSSEDEENQEKSTSFPRYSASMGVNQDEEALDYPAPKGEHTLNDLTDEDPEPQQTSYNSKVAGSTTYKMSGDNNQNDPYTGNIPHLNAQYPSSGVYSNREPGTKNNKGKLLLLVIIALLVICGGVYLLKGKSLTSKLSGSPEVSAAPISEATPAPTPVPTPAFDRSQFKIRVLNGTSTVGLAASEAAKLKTLGYQIDKTGNASSQSLKSTVVKVKSSATGLADNLVKDLAPDYVASASGSLTASDTADGEVDLGSQ